MSVLGGLVGFVPGECLIGRGGVPTGEPSLVASLRVAVLAV